MRTLEDVQDWNGRRLVGPDGSEIGTIDGIYLDDHTGEPTWALVDVGPGGRRAPFVLITDASRRDEDVQAPFDRATVQAAPDVDPEGHLSPADEAELRRHYAQGHAGQQPAAAGQARTPAAPEAGPPAGAPAAPASATPSSDADAGETMVLSEEELRVGTRERRATKVRMRKVTVTEEVTVIVPVTREEVRLEEVPVDAPDLDPAEQPPSGTPVPDGGEQEMILHAEVPVIHKKTVATERVRLVKDVVTDDVVVEDAVRRETLEVDGTSTTDER